MSAFFLVGGVAALFLGKLLRKQFKDRFESWDMTDAVVTRMTYQTTGDAHGAYFASYRYSYKGDEYNRASAVGTKQDRYKIGDSIKIFVNPADPAESEALHLLQIGPMKVSAYDFFVAGLYVTGALFIAVGIITAMLFATGVPMDD